MHVDDYQKTKNKTTTTKKKQVNAAASSTPWCVNLFLEYHQDSEKILKGGDVIRLFHTDQEKV